MSWYKGTVSQLSVDVVTKTHTQKGTFGSQTTTVIEQKVYTFLVELDNGSMLPLAGVADNEKQLPLLQVGDHIEFSRHYQSSATAFAQLKIDFQARKKVQTAAN
ncbi:MAG: hypothetical protein K2X77_24755 [Candidatus Obscuribacterales bacterium]|jgi:hypothetical protein|nr:hypothetical protein [Candidatus Obscuribacterales bacterium]